MNAMLTPDPYSLYRSFLLLLGFLTLGAYEDKNSPKSAEPEPEEVRGIYGSPKPLWDQGYRLEEIGVNAIFVHSGSIQAEMLKRAQSEGAQFFAEFATLNGENYGFTIIR